ncbi:heavy-metal-associated domain-containing protein [Haloarchaeobius amylolyticus]|uniref:heavy-metal-associated domain-containing protein n=1 Tax=Haloarchaeobius amylolyticus TaxID=1198296 RepID=UPI00226EDD49|nr:cation transporter [Haloarchaeobius amylolyticus]
MHDALTVSGMTCTGCERLVEREVRDIPGVEHVSARHTDDIVEVSVDPSVRPQVVDAIERLDYDVH